MCVHRASPAIDQPAHQISGADARAVVAGDVHGPEARDERRDRLRGRYERLALGQGVLLRGGARTATGGARVPRAAFFLPEEDDGARVVAAVAGDGLLATRGGIVHRELGAHASILPTAEPPRARRAVGTSACRAPRTRRSSERWIGERDAAHRRAGSRPPHRGSCARPSTGASAAPPSSSSTPRAAAAARTALHARRSRGGRSHRQRSVPDKTTVLPRVSERVEIPRRDPARDATGGR